MLWTLFKRTTLIFCFLAVFLIPCLFVEQSISIETQKRDMDQYLIKGDSSLFGILKIPKIGVENPIYLKDDVRNQVDLNVMLLEENLSFGKEKTYLVLASHSGNGIHAYFRNLDQLTIGDSIFLTYKNEVFEYEFIKKEEVLKQGFVYLNDYAFSYIALITCSKTHDDIQEVYYAKMVS